MIIVLDTNVLIAAFATRGLCAELLEMCITEHTVFLSDYILDECREKLEKKLKVPKVKIKKAEKYLNDYTEKVTPFELSRSPIKDKDDLPVLGTAIAAQAQLLITGDKELLALKKIENTNIISPREFLILNV